MEGIRFTLNETLEALNLTKNKLATEANIRPATIAEICEGNTKRFELKTLIAILDALNRLSPFQPMNIENVFIYINEKDRIGE